MTYSPCETCDKDERCSSICNEFINWFIPEWDAMVAKLRKQWGAEGDK